MCLPGVPFPCHAAAPQTCSLHSQVLFRSASFTTILPPSFPYMNWLQTNLANKLRVSSSFFN